MSRPGDATGPRFDAGQARAAVWQLGRRGLALGARPLLMGIVNVTPDSFFDGGRHFDSSAAVAHALDLAGQGAEILDIGGESTRPNSEPVEVEEELRRVVPVIAAVCRQTQVPVSVDTCKARVAREAIAAGAEIINDITALAGDPAMLATAAAGGCGVCAVHMQGTPRTMQQRPEYTDVVAEVTAFLAARRDALMAAGIDRAKIALDPGIGFGKTLQHNLSLLGSAWRLHALGCPVLVGPSRKAFIGQVLGDPAADRLAGTIGVCLALARQGVQILRVHDVAAVRQALLLYEAAGG